MSNRAARLHESPWRGVFHVTGGGSGFLAEMLCEPGASKTVLEARVPYAESALARLLGAKPDQACSEATARALAMAAFQEALRLTSTEPDPDREAALFGFACTASLATNRRKRGSHRAHVAVQTLEETWTLTLDFDGNRRDEEAALVEAIWAELAHVLDPDARTGSRQTSQRTRTSAPASWQALILGDEVAHATTDHTGGLLLPGAFNPLHRAHRKMLDIAEALTGLEGAFELSIANVDKPMLDYREIERRLAQFDRPVWLTHLPTFLEKARHFPGATFAIGLDTLLRIAEPVYYENKTAMLAAFEELEALDTRFVVFGRERDDRFVVLEDVTQTLPERLTARCVGVGADTFRDAISSTLLRRGSD